MIRSLFRSFVSGWTWCTHVSFWKTSRKRNHHYQSKIVSSAQVLLWRGRTQVFFLAVVVFIKVRDTHGAVTFIIFVSQSMMCLTKVNIAICCAMIRVYLAFTQLWYRVSVDPPLMFSLDVAETGRPLQGFSTEFFLPSLNPCHPLFVAE